MGVAQKVLQSELDNLEQQHRFQQAQLQVHRELVGMQLSELNAANGSAQMRKQAERMNDSPSLEHFGHDQSLTLTQTAQQDEQLSVLEDVTDTVTGGRSIHLAA